MIETDPIHATEHALAAELAATARRVLGWEATVDAHFREDTIVCLVEGDDGLPDLSAELVAAMERAVAEAVLAAIDREVVPPMHRSELSEHSMLVMLRLR